MWFKRRSPRTRDELSFHRDRLIADYVAQGMDRREAERRAFLAFGNVAVIEEQSKDVRGRWLEDLGKDLVYGLRKLRAAPAFTCIALATIAIAIGANTAVFSVVEAVLLRTLPVSRPHELRSLGWVAREGEMGISVEYSGGMRRLSATEMLATSFSYPVYTHIRERAASFSDLFVFQERAIASEATGSDARLNGLAVSGNFLGGLGVRVTAGRAIGVGDDQPGAPLVVMLTHGFWQRVFGGDRSVLGRALDLGGVPAVVIGVTARDFEGVQPGSPVDVLVPIAATTSAATLANARGFRFLIIGRLRPDVADERARAETEGLLHEALTGAANQRPQGLPGVLLAPAGRGLDRLRESYAQPLYLLTAIMAAVLLVGCANIAGLLLTRAAAREREIGVRLALGAGRGRLVRQLLTESALLALVGGALGIGLAFAAKDMLLPALSHDQVPRLAVTLSPFVLAVSFGLSLTVGLLSGLVPAVRGTRTSPSGMASRIVGSPAGARMRLSGGKTLIAFQVGASLALLVGAGLFMGTLANLRSQAVGFRPDHVLLFSIDGSTRYTAASLSDFYDRVLERLAALPDVRAASLSRYALLSGGMTLDRVKVPDLPEGQQDVRVHLHFVSPRHFETMSIPVRSGRDFTTGDREDAQPVAMVNEALARLMTGQTPLGRHIVYGGRPPGTSLEVVGVVADARFATLREPAPPTLYLPYRQSEQRAMTFAVRTTGDPLAIATPARQVLEGLDPRIQVRNVRTQEAQIDTLLRQERLFAYVASGFALLAVCLTGLGIYGTLAYAVSRRTAEIGLRMALGAARRDVVVMVLRESLVPVVAGIGVGLAAASLMTPLVKRMLFGLDAGDTTTLAVATVVVLVSALVAAWVPSRRASAIDPIVALRTE